MSMDFEKTLAMLSGQSVDAFMQSQLTEQDKAQIDNAIETLFSGLSLKNWLDGGTLGNAWTNALDTVRDVVFAFPYNNPATKYAQSAVFIHRQKWHIQIVASRDVQETIKCPADQRNSWYQNANTKVQNSIEILRKKIMEFESGTPRTGNNVQNTQQVFTHDNVRQIGEREHERERVREE